MHIMLINRNIVNIMFIKHNIVNIMFLKDNIVNVMFLKYNIVNIMFVKYNTIVLWQRSMYATCISKTFLSLLHDKNVLVRPRHIRQCGNHTSNICSNKTSIHKYFTYVYCMHMLHHIYILCSQMKYITKSFLDLLLKLTFDTGSSMDLCMTITLCSTHTNNIIVSNI